LAPQEIAVHHLDSNWLIITVEQFLAYKLLTLSIDYLSIFHLIVHLSFST